MRPRARLRKRALPPTPPSIQANPDPGGGAPQPTGTGNVTAMLDRGYIEFLFKTADTPLAKQFDTAMARYRGLHLVAFAVADAAGTHARLATAGFALQPVVDMQRPVETSDGNGVAAFSIVRLQPGEMPEGRIQALTHRTEATVWQERWLSHRNGATGLIDVVIVEPDVAEAAARFARFLGRPAAFDRFGQSITLDRGRVQLMSSLMLEQSLPGLEIPALPFICAYGIAVKSLAVTAACLDAGGIAFTRRAGCLVAAFPVVARRRMLGVCGRCRGAAVAGVLTPTVIPGRRAAANPESRIFQGTQGSLDSGFALARAPE